MKRGSSIYPVVDGKKKCTKCSETKPVTEFYAIRKMGGSPQSSCISCNKEYGKARYLANKNEVLEKNRANELKRRCRSLGKDAGVILQMQDGKCAACGVDLNSIPKNARHLDHCHETGHVREWLCRACNVIIGFALDNPSVLRKCASYLEKHKRLHAAINLFS